MKKAAQHPSEPLAVLHFTQSVGDRIRAIRIARGFLQIDMAHRALMSVDTLRRIETGHPSVRFADVARALWALDEQSLMTALKALHDDELIESAKNVLPIRVRVPKSSAKTKPA